VRDYFYVEDGVGANVRLAEALRTRPELAGEGFNFSNELQVTVLALVGRILSHMGSSLEADVRNEASHEIKHQYLSAAKARRLLDWTPSFDLDAGLERTTTWYRDFLSHAS